MKAAWIKLIVAIILDILDFTMGRIPGLGVPYDMGLTLIAYLMFGPKGLVQIWEVVDFSEQVDGFVPTLTLIALAELRAARKKQAAAIADNTG